MITYCGQPAMQFTLFSTMLPPRLIENARCDGKQVTIPLPPGAVFPPNGLPVFHLTWRNDDGGPGYGPDSRLNFVAPQDGDYILHLKDVRGL